MSLFGSLRDATGSQSCSIRIELAADPQSLYAPLKVTFHASVSGATPPLRYDWWFGDGSQVVGIGSAETYTYTYEYFHPWPYEVYFNVKDARGCESRTRLAVQPGVALLGAVAGLLVLAGAGILLLTRTGRKEKICGSCGCFNPPYTKSFCINCGNRLQTSWLQRLVNEVI